jgi:hypothetical protein
MARVNGQDFNNVLDGDNSSVTYQEITIIGNESKSVCYQANLT